MNSAALWADLLRPLPRWANFGAPISRTLKARVKASLLGDGPGQVRCLRVLRLALDFGQADPIELITTLLNASGTADPESLRSVYSIPSNRLIAAPQGEPVQRLDARNAAPRDVLEQALLLGLCTRNLYDPARPVLWTTTSLTRAVELFDPAGFYS